MLTTPVSANSAARFSGLSRPLLVLALLGFALPALAGAPVGPPVRDLGDDRFQVGTIEVDRRAGSFSLPGRVIRLEPPLEFVAVSRDGMKGYESLLEMDTSAVEFNLACILIGLEPSPDAAIHHFDPRPLEGLPIRVQVGWTTPSGPVWHDAGQLLAEQGRAEISDEWVYLGSGFTPSGEYLAELYGTLISFVHAPGSIIEHRGGLGIGRYGSVGGDPLRAPPVGTPITLRVTRLAR